MPLIIDGTTITAVNIDGTPLSNIKVDNVTIFTSSSKLPTPNLSIRGTMLSWYTISNATGYSIEVYYNYVYKTVIRLGQYTTSYDISDTLNYDYGRYEYKIKATSNNPSYSDSSYDSVVYTYSEPEPEPIHVADLKLNFIVSLATYGGNRQYNYYFIADKVENYNTGIYEYDLSDFTYTNIGDGTMSPDPEKNYAYNVSGYLEDDTVEVKVKITDTVTGTEWTNYLSTQFLIDDPDTNYSSSVTIPIYHDR